MQDNKVNRRESVERSSDNLITTLVMIMTSFPIGASYHIVRGFNIHFGSDGQIRLDLSYTFSYPKLL